MESAFLKIVNVKISAPSGLLSNGQIIISDGKIVEITGQDQEVPHAEITDTKGYHVTLGRIDTYVHGGNGRDFTEATLEAFYAIIRAHALQGTMALYPTLVATSIGTFRRAIKIYEHIMNRPERGAHITGLHLEGNYLNMAMKDGQDPNYIYPPDPQEYRELLNSTQCAKRWSAAPELDGALELGEHASVHGVLVSLVCTTVDYFQVKKVYEIGFTHAIRFYDATTSVHKDCEHKHEGTVEGIYPMEDMIAKVVADGIHVPPIVLKLVCQTKEIERMSLITDVMVAAVCDNGTEHFPDSRAVIEGGVCKLADRSAIAESTATGARLIRTLVEKVETSLHDAVRMASESPACLTGLLDRKGTSERGKNVDIITSNNDIEVQETFIEGRWLSKE